MQRLGSFQINSSPEHFRKIYEVIDQIVQKTGLSGREKYRFAVCITEAFTNACVHGNRRDPRKNVRITFELHDKCLVAEIEDEGSGSLADMPQTFELEEIKSDNFSGRGVAIMNKFADNFNIIEKNGKGLKVRMEWDLSKQPPHRKATSSRR